MVGRKGRRQWSLLIVLAILVSCYLLSERLEEKQQKNEPYGGTLRLGTCNQPTVINPLLTNYSVSVSLLDLIFNGLVRINHRGEVEPDLARSWEISPDGLVYTFHLLPGIRFHDGVECTAEDVQFTYEQVTDRQVGSPYASYFELVKEWEVIDRYTIRLHLKEPFVPILSTLQFRIIPRHLLLGEDMHTTAFNRHPIGTGPFKMAEWKEGERIILTANEDYYEGRPYLDKIVVRVYPLLSHIWAGLMREEIDLVRDLDIRDYWEVKRDPTFQTNYTSSNFYYALVYNLQHPLFASYRMRRALSLAIRPEQFCEQTYQGYGEKSVGPFPSRSWAFNPEIKPLPYDPERARYLLADAGWIDEDGDGVREKEGKELEIEVLVDGRDEKRMLMALYLRQQWQLVGIKFKIQLYDDETVLKEVYLQPHHFQAYLKIFQYGTDPDYASRYWHSSTPYCSYWGYRNEEVDRLFEQGRITLDREERTRIYQRIQALIYRDLPATFLFSPYVFNGINARFGGVGPYEMHLPTYTIKDWYIIPARRKEGR